MTPLGQRVKVFTQYRTPWKNGKCVQNGLLRWNWRNSTWTITNIIEIMSFVATTLNHGASSMIWKRSYAVQDLEKSSKMMLFLPFSYIEDRLRCAHQVKEGFPEDVLNRLVILIIFPFYNFILPGFKNQPPAVYLYCAARAVVVC